MSRNFNKSDRKETKVVALFLRRSRPNLRHPGRKPTSSRMRAPEIGPAACPRAIAGIGAPGREATQNGPSGTN